MSNPIDVFIKVGNMMRDILFRGKRTDNGEWVEGRLLADDVIVPCGQEFRVLPSNVLELDEDLTLYIVRPETVGQHTGFLDKNGKKIFEGDIISFKMYNPLGWTRSRIGAVQYCDRLPMFFIVAETGDAWDWGECDDMEVVGNVHDDPELLREGRWWEDAAD